MLLYRMAFQKEPTMKGERVEVLNPLPFHPASSAEGVGPQLRMRRRNPNSLGAPFARTCKDVVFATAVSVFATNPASVSTAHGAPSALLVHSFRSWAARTFPAGAPDEEREAFVASLIAQNRQLAAALKAADHEAELEKLRAQLATADAERLLLIERA
jgi:hypothetical protein